MFFPSSLRATFPENWPDDVKALAAPGAEVALTPGDVTVLGHFNRHYMEHFEYSGHDALTDDTQQAIQDALEVYPDGVMPRLGLCSWKGSTLVHEPCRTYGDVMKVITQDDLRVARALSASAVAGEGAVLHLRKWVDIPEWSEFRIYIRAGRVIGMSQYYHRKRYPEIADNINDINRVLFEFTADTLPLLPLETVVMDVHFTAAPGAGLSAEDIALIELNPLGEGTDPCLFSWNEPESFDGRLRYLP